MFFAIALNPNAASYAKIADSERDTVDKSMASLLERLLTSTCLAEAKKAVQYEGDAALSQSFKLLGEVAATEMFGNPAVSAGTQKFLKYLDSDKLSNALGVGAAQ